MGADEEALRRDLAATAFTIGVRRGYWRVEGIIFPHVLFFIAAAPIPAGPPGFLLLSECTGYSAIGPTSQLWNGGTDSALAPGHRPQMVAFSNWAACLYHPIDRLARGHWDSPTAFPHLIWTPEKKINFLTETVYDLLHATEYVGAAVPPNALNVPQKYLEARP